MSMDDVTIRCMWCGQTITALNPCDNASCMVERGRMAAASARLDASFKETPLGLLHTPDEYGWTQKQHMDQAEAMGHPEL